MDSSPISQAGHVVDLSIHFAKVYMTVAANDGEILDRFINHVQNHGLENLPGRLKPSWDVPKQDPFFLKKLNMPDTGIYGITMSVCHILMKTMDTAITHLNGFYIYVAFRAVHERKL